jgi:DNA-directed RNA polymerase subunit E'/Rpb7
MNKNDGQQLQNPKLYETVLIHKRISVSFSKIGNNMNDYFKQYSENNIEGKCHKGGYIKPYSTTIVNYTTGLLKNNSVIYDVVYSMDVCFPYENMEVLCKIKNITKIGIRGIISDDHNPIILFISREHNASKNFDDYEEGQIIKVKIIGHRFEINDENISVIGEII